MLKRHQVLNSDQRDALEYSDLARSHDTILNPYHDNLEFILSISSLLFMQKIVLQLGLTKSLSHQNVLISKSDEVLYVYSVSADDSASTSAGYSHQVYYLKVQLKPDALWQILAITAAKPAQY